MTTKRKRKRFTPEFKAKVVIEALDVESSAAEICRRYNITEAQLSQWKRQLRENMATLFEPNRKQSDASAERIAELELLAGKLTQALDIQKKHSIGLPRTGLKKNDALLLTNVLLNFFVKL